MSISISNISKSYKKVKALSSITFDVKEGEIFGLIGPDGAGKTTLFRLLTTLLIADEGSATVAGDRNGMKTLTNAMKAAQPAYAAKWQAIHDMKTEGAG